MTYVLQSMLHIRTMRENRAATELTSARREVTHAEELLFQRKHDLEAYESTKETRRDRIFQSVLNRVVTMGELDLAREGVSRIDEEGILKADNVLQAEDVVRKCKDNVKVAQRTFVNASKNRMKIEEHRSNWVQEKAAEAESQSEIELEDFTGKKIIDDTTDSEYCEEPKDCVEKIRATTPLPLPMPMVHETPLVFADMRPTESVTGSSEIKMFIEAAEAVADAILVSSGFEKEEDSIVVRLRPEILGGSEVRITAKSGALSVVMHPASQDVQAIIEANRTQFEQHLAEKVRSWRIAVYVKKGDEIDERI